MCNTELMSQINHSTERRYAEITKLDTLTVAEVAELIALSERHHDALAVRDYPLADSIRAELMLWGAWPPEHGWCGVAESRDHRTQRLAKRLDASA